MNFNEQILILQGYETYLHHIGSISTKGQDLLCNLFFQHPTFLHKWSHNQSG